MLRASGLPENTHRCLTSGGAAHSELVPDFRWSVAPQPCAVVRSWRIGCTVREFGLRPEQTLTTEALHLKTDNQQQYHLGLDVLVMLCALVAILINILF